jgi:hypothetical protein
MRIRTAGMLAGSLNLIQMLDLRESVLPLVDRSQRFTKCWLWCGDFRGRVPIHRREHATKLVWEEVNNQPLPTRTVLEPVCGHMTCVNPEHKQVKYKGLRS